MNQRAPVCLTIAGLDPSGGAGIVADIRTIEAFACRAAAAVTSITFQNSRAVNGFVHLNGEQVVDQIKPVFEELDVSAVKIGMLPTADVVRSVALLLRSFGARNIVTDPVIAASSGSSLIEPEAVDAIVKEIFPLATLITPNIPEAERFTNISITDDAALARAGKTLQQAGARNVLIKGGHFESDSQVSRDLLFAGDEMTIFDSNRVHNVRVRGTGCMLSSAIAANLALGRDLESAVRFAKEYVHAKFVATNETAEAA